MCNIPDPPDDIQCTIQLEPGFSCVGFSRSLVSVVLRCCLCIGFVVRGCGNYGGTAAAVPPPFRPGEPAICGSRPLVTPY